MNAEELRDKIVAALNGGSLPDSAVKITDAISSYVKSKGTALPPTIRYTLAPCTGAGWLALIPLATGGGVAPYLISVGVATEFGASIKVVPAEHGTRTLPMAFNTGVVVPNLSNLTDFREVWLEISKAIIKYFAPEIK